MTEARAQIEERRDGQWEAWVLGGPHKDATFIVTDDWSLRLHSGQVVLVRFHPEDQFCKVMP